MCRVLAVCRDASGVYLGASAVVFNNIEDPEVLEVLATREALALAEDLYEQKVFIASDSLTAVEAIKGGTAAAYGAVVHEITDRARFFSPCSFSHEFQSSDFETHNLAKHALTLGTGRHVWLGHPGNLLFVPVNIVTVE